MVRDCITRALLNTQKKFSVEKAERGMNSYTLSLQQCCPIAPHPQPPLQRGGEGLITVLSRNWSIFNSSGELTGTSTQWHLTVLSGLKPAWVVGVVAVTNSLSHPNLDFTAAGSGWLPSIGPVVHYIHYF